MTSIRFVATAALVFASATPAFAQATVPSAGSTATVPEKTAPATDLDQTSGSLSKKLGDTNGVIKPKSDVDPDMPVGTPKAGAMPVIKPGQTGGGVAK